MIRLGVNIDHCATLRQVRGGENPYPDILQMARLAVQGGARQITIHLREDRRHIQDDDVAVLCKARPTLINLEMAVTDEMLRKALKHKPDWVCLVPEKRAELTTEGGLDVVKLMKGGRLERYIRRLQKPGIEVSLFIDPSIDQVKAAGELGVDAVEFHTGTWVHADRDRCTRPAKAAREWSKLVEAAELANFYGLGVHAGHGLDLQTTARIRRLPHLREVNIGHSIVCHALEVGLKSAVRAIHRKLK